jgi:CRISPR/Cas system CSM-associated protein Csm3 (group 7 of RAMP superfamily)
MDYGPEYATTLFGGERGNEKGSQSALIVEDALGDKPEIEIRDGVSIDPATRTAKDRERYDRQLLNGGTKFNLGFELIVTERDGDDAGQLKAALALALYGLQNGDIRLGGRKRRGYGQCRVVSWKAWRYDLGTMKGLKGWLAHGRQDLAGFEEPQWQWEMVKGGDGILDWDVFRKTNRPSSTIPMFKMSVAFEIDGSVLIRSGFETSNGPDVAHLRSKREGRDVPIMSGTSLAGVIRSQSQRIARTLAGDEGIAVRLVEDMFGGMQRPDSDMSFTQRSALRKRASRVTVNETVISGQHDLVQTRVKIDRFTGGVVESALFAEQPAFGGGFTLDVMLREPKPAEVGLLLLVLKDLWTGFTPVGGGSNVGRGRLKGQKATIEYDGEIWRLDANGDGVAISTAHGSSPSRLNTYVTALSAALEGA